MMLYIDTVLCWLLYVGDLRSLGVLKMILTLQSVGEEGLTRLTLHVCEEGLRLTEEASHRLNKPISTW